MNRNGHQRIFSRENLPHIEALVGILTLIFGICFSSIQIKEARKLDRVSKSIDYCNMYQGNSEIVDSAEKTFNTSKSIGNMEEYKDIFKEDKESKDIKEMRCKFSNSSDKKKKNIIDDNKLSFYRLANYYENAIIGVNKNIFDKDIIMSCLATKMVCFREKYSIRTDIFNPKDKEIEEIRKFIGNGNNAKKHCGLATKDYWEPGYQSNLTCHES